MKSMWNEEETTPNQIEKTSNQKLIDFHSLRLQVTWGPGIKRVEPINHPYRHANWKHLIKNYTKLIISNNKAKGIFKYFTTFGMKYHFA